MLVRCLSLILSLTGVETLVAASASLRNQCLHCTRVAQCTHDTESEGTVVEMWMSLELQFGCPVRCSVNEVEGITDSGTLSGPVGSVPTWSGRKTVAKSVRQVSIATKSMELSSEQ